MTKTVEIKWLIEELDWIGQALYDIASADPVVANPSETPTETLNTIAIGTTVYSLGGGASTVEVIMGGLDRTYGTTPSNYIGTFSSWADIDSGKSFSDYDEIKLVCIGQGQIGGATLCECYSIPVNLLAARHTVGFWQEWYSSYYVKYALDYDNNKFYLDNWNYMCPIALIGIKY